MEAAAGGRSVNLLGSKLFDIHQGDSLPWLRSLPDRAVAMWLTSPPYEDARRYSTGHKLRGDAWAQWYRPFVVEMCRTCSGFAVVNMSAKRRDWQYSGAVEMLVADLLRLDGIVCGPAPYAWTKNGIPGSGSKKYHRRNWEPVYLFALADRIETAWTDPLAFGSPPVYGQGGEMSNRTANGRRVNAPRSPRDFINNTMRRPDGKRKSEEPSGKRRPLPAVADPGNVIYTAVGGNLTGESAIVHRGQAPMNLGLAERFVCWYAPPRSIVGDPMSGTGTTGAAALRWGRRFLGADEDPQAVADSRERFASITFLGYRP